MLMISPVQSRTIGHGVRAVPVPQSWAGLWESLHLPSIRPASVQWNVEGH